MNRPSMRWVSVGTNVTLLVAAFLVFTQGRAHAYLDPGTGSILFQVLAGAVLASLFAVKVFWQRVQSFVTVSVLRRKPEPEHTDDGAN